MKEYRKTDRGRLRDLEIRQNRVLQNQSSPSSGGSSGSGGAPAAHASTHQNGGGDEVATATPTNNAIPKANASGKLAAGWGGAASTLATLNSSSKVVEDPANATATPAASKIVIADGSGLVDGWVSDAAAGTKGKVKLAGDLAGTAAAPEVAAVHETGGPTKLTIGTIGDGEFVKRNGSNLVSAAIAGGTYDELDTLLGKKFFVDEGYLTGLTNFKRFTGTPPAFDGTGAGTYARDPGRYRNTNAGNFLGYFDIGSSKTKVLMILGQNPINIDFGFVGCGPNLPTTGTPDGYNAINYNAGILIQKSVSGALSTILTGTLWSIADAAIAMYVDFSANTLYLFGRRTGDWQLVGSVSNSVYTTARYVWLRAHTNNVPFGMPFAVWTN